MCVVTHGVHMPNTNIPRTCTCVHMGVRINHMSKQFVTALGVTNTNSERRAGGNRALM